MDGLIPMAYRAIVKSRTHRRYECLSSGSAISCDDVSEFFLPGKSNFAKSQPAPIDRTMEIDGASVHRRRWSLADASSLSCREGRVVGAVDGSSSPPRPRQLVRFRSHRFFSCISPGE